MISVSTTPDRKARSTKIDEMASKTPVYTVIENKWKCIRHQELSMDHDETVPKTVTMQLTEDMFWKSLPRDIYNSLIRRDLVLWKLRWETIHVENDEVRSKKYSGLESKTVRVQVPYVLPKGTYTYHVKFDKDMRKVIHDVYVLGEEDKDVYYYIGIKGGPNVDDDRFNSDCDAILEEYEKYQKFLKDAEDIRQENKKPTTYFEHLTPNEHTTEISIMKQLAEYASTEKTESGHKKKLPSKLVRMGDNGLLIPPMHRISPQQPVVATPLSTEEAEMKFINSLSNLFQVPSSWATKMRNPDNAGAIIDEERNRLLTSLSEITKEIITVLQLMFESIYKKKNVPVHLPIFVPTNITTIHTMFERGYLDDETAKKEMEPFTGISYDRMSKRPLIRSERLSQNKKKHKEDGDSGV